jgi:hypothetical protein
MAARKSAPACWLSLAHRKPVTAACCRAARHGAAARDRCRLGDHGRSAGRRESGRRIACEHARHRGGADRADPCLRPFVGSALQPCRDFGGAARARDRPAQRGRLCPGPAGGRGAGRVARARHVRRTDPAGLSQGARRLEPGPGRGGRDLRPDRYDLRHPARAARGDTGRGGLYISSAYWFTASTSFANPAVTAARSLSDTFAGIAPQSAPLFILGQLAGTLAALACFNWLYREAPAP